MSLYEDTKSRVFALALSASELQSGLESLEDYVDYLKAKVSNRLDSVKVLNTQLEGLFQFIKDNFRGEGVNNDIEEEDGEGTRTNEGEV